MKWVFEHSQTRGSARVLMLALADMANDDGECYPGKANLARKVNVTPQQITRLIQECERLGELKVIPRIGTQGSMHNATNLYQLVAICKQVSSCARPPTPKKVRKPAAPVVSDDTVVSPAILPSDIAGNTTLVSPAIPKTKDNPKVEPKKSTASAATAKPSKPKPDAQEGEQASGRNAQKNAMFDEIVRLFKYDPDRLTKSERSSTAKAAWELLNAGYRPEHMRIIYRYMEQTRSKAFNPALMPYDASAAIADFKATYGYDPLKEVLELPDAAEGTPPDFSEGAPPPDAKLHNIEDLWDKIAEGIDGARVAGKW